MDLYNIPNDTGGKWRLNKYCEYQATVPPINPITYTAFAKRHHLTRAECVYLAWLNSTCYSAETACFMFTKLPFKDLNIQTLERFWAKYKERLIFISARQYAKNMDWFVPLVNQFFSAFGLKPYTRLKTMCRGTAVENYEAISKYVNKLTYMGRFSTDLFMEALVHMSAEGLLELELEYPEFNWNHGSNITTGIMNVFYMDEWANEFDKTKKLSDEQKAWLDKSLLRIQNRIRKLYPDQNSDVSEITPKLCSFRNLFKGSRYGGYHHDRQLEILLKYCRDIPQSSALWVELFKIREAEFDHSLLGEKGGWSGIRKERKKLFLLKGVTGIETID